MDRELARAVGNDRQFAALCTVIGQPAPATEPADATDAERVRNRDRLRTVLEEHLAKRPAAEWAEDLSAVGYRRAWSTMPPAPARWLRTLDRTL